MKKNDYTISKKCPYHVLLFLDLVLKYRDASFVLSLQEFVIKY